MDWIQAHPALAALLAGAIGAVFHLKGFTVPVMSDILRRIQTGDAGPAAHPLLQDAAKFLTNPLLSAQAEPELKALIASWKSRLLPPPEVKP